MAYSPLARARLAAYRSETPEERAARHDRERQQRALKRVETAARAKSMRLLKQRLEMWYRERGRTTT